MLDARPVAFAARFYLALALGVASLGAGCGASSGGLPAYDGGARLDGGADAQDGGSDAVDGGADPLDGGATLDGGAHVDGGALVDGGSHADGGAVSDGGGATGNHIQTVFLILMENHSWSEIKGSASAPYVNHTLLAMASYAESYKGPLSGNLHPSEPNYIWLEAGDNLGIINDNSPASNHQSTTDHLVTRLESKGIAWRSYQEGIAGGTCPLTSSGNYNPKHNPMVYFEDVNGWSSGHANPNAPRCVNNVRPLSQLTTDLQNGGIGRYNFITPDLCNDMHTACAPTNDEVKQGDNWLALWIPRIMASPAYQQGGAIFITWDESEPLSAACVVGNCPIGMIVVSPHGKGGGYSNTIAYDHSSTLKTVQTIFDATPFLRHAGDPGVNDLRDLFRDFP